MKIQEYKVPDYKMIANCRGIRKEPNLVTVLEQIIFIDEYIDFYEDNHYRFIKLEKFEDIMYYIAKFEVYNEHESCKFEVHIGDNQATTERINIAIIKEKGTGISKDAGIDPINLIRLDPIAEIIRY